MHLKTFWLVFVFSEIAFWYQHIAIEFVNKNFLTDLISDVIHRWVFRPMPNVITVYPLCIRRFVTLFASEDKTNSFDLNILRAVRVLRPLKLVSGVPSMYFIIKNWLGSVPSFGLFSFHTFLSVAPSADLSSVVCSLFFYWWDVSKLHDFS